jgi:hypothetical protein
MNIGLKNGKCNILVGLGGFRILLGRFFCYSVSFLSYLSTLIFQKDCYMPQVQDDDYFIE